MIGANRLRGSSTDAQTLAMAGRISRGVMVAGLWLGLGAGLAGCVVTKKSRPADVNYTVRPVDEVERWDIVAPFGSAGQLVRLEIYENGNPMSYYRVVNARGEWVGHVTDQLQFSRRVPFAADEEVMGTFSMKEGLGALLGLRAIPDLEPMAVEATYTKK